MYASVKYQLWSQYIKSSLRTSFSVRMSPVTPHRVCPSLYYPHHWYSSGPNANKVSCIPDTAYIGYDRLSRPSCPAGHVALFANGKVSPTEVVQLKVCGYGPAPRVEMERCRLDEYPSEVYWDYGLKHALLCWEQLPPKPLYRRVE